MNEEIIIPKAAIDMAKGPDVSVNWSSGLKGDGFKEHSHFTPEQKEEMLHLIKESVGACLKYKMASQNMEMVEEMKDQLAYLCATQGFKLPSAAELALWKDGEV